jgi:hypothetical protein
LKQSCPADFLEFLSVANGGFFEFCIDVDGETLSFGDVYQTGKDSSGSYGFGTVVGEIGQARKGFIDIPRQVFPFARDGGGSYVFLDLTEEGNGRVIAFIHGLPEWTGKSPDDRFVEIAPSFSEYIEMHYECPDLV